MGEQAAELAEKLGISVHCGPPREDQVLPVGDWIKWLILAGRGAGKTRVGAETVLDWAVEHTGIRIHVVARTIGDCRGTLFEGESGILSCLPAKYRDCFNRSLMELTLPGGVFIKGFGAEETSRLRGPQCHFAWADELASWRSKKVEGQVEHAWDMLLMGLRLKPKSFAGVEEDPRVVITTTPKPNRIIVDLLKDPSVHLTRASTYENRANLAKAFLDQILRKYEGTRLGRQELYAEVLEAMDGALWNMELLEELRVEKAPPLKRIVVAIDPAATSEEESNETGIVAVGVADLVNTLKIGVEEEIEHGYLLEDVSCREKPIGWARAAIALYKRLQADAIVAEINNGGEMVESTIHMVDANVKVIVVHATRGKSKRAEPVSALYEQRRFHHVVPADHPDKFRDLEEQQCNYTANDEYGLRGSPDRMDALVWGATELMVQGLDAAGALEFYRQEAGKARIKQAAAARLNSPGGALGVAGAPESPAPVPKAVPLAQDPDYIRHVFNQRR